MFDTLSENCIFYISQLYEFSHRLGQTRSFGDVGSMSGLPESDTPRRFEGMCQGAFTPFCLDGHTENPVGGGMKKSNKYNARIVRDLINAWSCGMLPCS
jgi:hypothetical protein